MTTIATVASCSAAVAATSARTEKVALLVDVLRAAAPDELSALVPMLAGRLRQPTLGVGWAGVSDLDARPAEAPSLTVLEVDAVLERVAATHGDGSVATRRELLTGLFERATADEQPWLRAVLMRHVLQGALEGVVVTAVAKAWKVPVASVRRAAMLTGSTAEAARIAATEGRAGLDALHLKIGVAVGPMLAATSSSVSAALAEFDGPAVVEDKLDGIRVQVHRDGDDVRVFSRNLRDITSRTPEVVALARSLDADSFVLDGESYLVDQVGRAAAFQESMSSLATQLEDGDDGAPATRPTGARVATTIFDLLALDGVSLIDEPLATRREALARLVPDDLLPHAIVVEADDGATAPQLDALLDEAVGRGNEGVMVKDLASPYAAGRRGKAWRKVKPVHTLDLVVIGVEWGSGRRKGLLSNLHLGAYDPDGDVVEPGGFVMLGKTFKGLTDEMLAWQTEHLLALKIEEGRDASAFDDDQHRWAVRVRPELVVEIAFDGIQTSRRYPGRMALRFARVKAHRPDKDATEADTIATVQRIHRLGQAAFAPDE